MNMKKIAALLLCCAVAAGSLTACGGTGTKAESGADSSAETGAAAAEENPYEGLTLYQSESGISLYMADGFEEAQVEGSACCFKGGSSAVSCQEEFFSAMEEVGYSGSEMTEEEYAKLLIEAYQLDCEAETDEYGSVSFLYTKDVMGASMSYYAFVDKGSEAFWTTTFMCGTASADEMEADFRLWGSSIQIP